MPTIRFDIQTNAQGAITGINAVSGALKAAGQAGTGAGNNITSAFDRVEATLNKMKSAVVGFIGAFVFTRAIRGITDIIQAGIEFESTFAGIRKTVDGGVGDFARLAEQMRELAKVTPIAVTELNKIGEVAGQIGVPTEKIKDFVSTIAKVGATTSIPIDEAATSFARLANILGLPIESVKTLASVMFKLDASFPASTREILEFSMNIAGAGRNVGLSSNQIAALSTALASVGLHSEKAGSAMSRVFYEMQKAVVDGGVKLQNFASISQMSSAQFSKAFKDDAGKALLAFLSGLKNVDDSGLEMIQVLESLGLKNVRVADVVVRSALAVDVYRKAMTEATAEAEKGGKTLDERYAVSIETTSAKLQVFMNRLNDVFIQISDRWTPAIISAVGGATDFVEALNKNASAVAAVARVVTDLVAAIALMKLLTWASNLGIVTEAMTMLGKVAAGTVTQVELLNAAIASTKLIAGVAAWVALVAALYEYEKAATAAGEAERQADKDKKTSVDSTMKTIEALDKAGISINNYIDETGDMDAAIGRAAKALVEKQKAQAEATAEEAAHAAQIKIVTEAAKKQREEIEKLKNAVTDTTTKHKNLVVAIDEMVAAGVKQNVIIDEYKSQITEYVERNQLMGRAVDANVGALYNLITAEKDAKHEVEDSGVILQAQLNHLVKVREAQTAWNQTIDGTATKIAMETAVTQRAIQANQILGNLGIGLINREVAGPEQHDMISPDAARRGAENAEKALKGISLKISNDFDRAFDTLFRHFAEKGKVSSKDIADFFVKAFDSVTDKLTEPLRKAFSDSLASLFGGKEGTGGILGGLTNQIGKISKGLGDSLAGVFGGAEGGKLAGGIGKVLNGAISGGIGMAINFGMQALTSLLGKSGSEVNNKLVQDIQNPFVKAVGELMDSFKALQDSGKLTLSTAIEARTNLASLFEKFKADTAAYAAMGEKNSKAVAGAFATIEQYFGKDLSGLFGKIDDAIVGLGGSAGMTTAQLNDLQAAMEIAAQFASSVKQLVESVTGKSEDIDVMVAALTQLQAQGVPTAFIIEKLGSNILNMADTMRALGQEIPPVIEQFVEMANNMSRLKDVEAELASIRTEAINLINKALDDNEAAIAASTDKIKNWTDKIKDLDAQIGDLTAKLQDAKYWQEEYEKAISSAEQAYEDAKRKREDAEKEIEDLTMSLARRQLQNAVDAAQEKLDAEKTAKKKEHDDAIAALVKQQKIVDSDNTLSLEARKIQHDALQEQIDHLQNSYDDSLTSEQEYLDAKKALEDFDKAQKEKQFQEDMERLAKLKASLTGLQQAEEQRRLELEAAKVAAHALVEQEKKDLQDRINALFAQRLELQQSILAEQAHVASMQAMRPILESMLEQLGGDRTRSSTIDQINLLIQRGIRLEAERASLTNLTGVAAQSVDVMNALAVAIQHLIDVASQTPAPAPEPHVPPPGTPPPPPPDEPPPPPDHPMPHPGDRGGTGIPHFAGDISSPTSDYGAGGLGIFGIFGGRYGRGTPYVPRDMMAYLHRGERVVTAQDNQGGYGNIIFAPGSVVINTSSGNGRQLANDFVNEIQFNGDLRRRMRQIIK